MQLINTGPGGSKPTDLVPGITISEFLTAVQKLILLVLFF